MDWYLPQFAHHLYSRAAQAVPHCSYKKCTCLALVTLYHRVYQSRLAYHFLYSFILAMVALFWLHRAFLAQSDAPPTAPAALPYTLYLPMIQTVAEFRQIPPMRDWDPRLTARGAHLVEAQVQPGEGYWQLVRARWFDPSEAEGRHHILIDLLDSNSQRQSNVPITIAWHDGIVTLTTEPKPGEPYAANYAMYALAPAYSAQPATDAPADRVEGMGLGTIGDPYRAFHTSYGLVWQWTVISDAPVITPTATATTTLTVTPTATVRATATPTATVTPTLVITATPTVAPTGTPTAPALAQATVVGCQADNRGSRFEGYIYQGQQPVNGYRIVFSYEANGPWVTQPALSGGGNPGFYAHIISAGVARAGNWHTWLVDQNNQRISTIASFTTDGEGGACNLVFVDFFLFI